MTATKMKVSDAGLGIIKRFEGFQPHWYTCPAGKLTIGYGHVKRQSDGVKAPLTEEQATALLRRDAAIAECDVHLLVKVPLAQCQFDALVSFAFNLGAANLKSSTLLRKLNAGDHAGAAREFGRWVNSNGKPLAGLIARREAERAMFEGGMDREKVA